MTKSAGKEWEIIMKIPQDLRDSIDELITYRVQQIIHVEISKYMQEMNKKIL